MKILSRNRRIYNQVPHKSEVNYEKIVMDELNMILQDFDVITFKQSVYDDLGNVNRPDLAIVAKNRSDWYVVEVELSNHSLERHVYPQVETFTKARYTMEHAKYISEKLGGKSVIHEIENMVKIKYPGVVVVVESDAVLNKGWGKLNKELDVNLTFVETYWDDIGDFIVGISGFLPEIKNEEIIILRKHSIFNAFVCRPTGTISKLHGKDIIVEYENSQYIMTITSTSVEALFFMRPSPNIEEKKKYRLTIGYMGRVCIGLDSLYRVK